MKKSLLICLSALLSMGCASINLVPTQAPILRLEEVHDFGATRVEFSPDSKYIASAGYLGEIQIWRVPDGEHVQHLQAHETFISDLAWLDANTLVSAAKDGEILFWDLPSARVTQRIKSSALSAMVLFPQHDKLLTGHKDGRVHVWAANSGQMLATYTAPGAVSAVAIHPAANLVAVATDNAQVWLLNSELKPMQQLSSADKNVHSLAFSPDGLQLVGGAWFKLLFWELGSARLTTRDTEHIGAITSIDYSPDGEYLVTLGRHTDANIRLVNVKSGRLERRLRAHNLCGYAIRISPDGQYVVSASEDESVRLYDIRTPYRPTWGK